MSDADEVVMEKSGSFLSRNGKKLFALVVILAIIAGVVVDIVLKSCVSTETAVESFKRVQCALNSTADLSAGLPNGTIVCSNEEAKGWELDTELNACVAPQACVLVGIDLFLDWIAENPGIGAVVTALVYAVATVAFIPGSVLTIGSGAAFAGALGLGTGVLIAAISVIVGASIGAMLAFLLGRYLLRGAVAEWAAKYRVLGAIDAALADEGLKIVLLLRFSPAIPFSAFNYVMGTTGCTFRDYAIGTVFGIMPGTVGYVFVGSAVASAASGGSGLSCQPSQEEQTINTVLLVVGIVATILAVCQITRVANKKLKQYIDVEEEGDEQVTAIGTKNPNFEDIDNL